MSTDHYYQNGLNYSCLQVTICCAGILKTKISYKILAKKRCIRTCWIPGGSNRRWGSRSSTCLCVTILLLLRWPWARHVGGGAVPLPFHEPSSALFAAYSPWSPFAPFWISCIQYNVNVKYSSFHSFIVFRILFVTELFEVLSLVLKLDYFLLIRSSNKLYTLKRYTLLY